MHPTVISFPPLLSYSSLCPTAKLITGQAETQIWLIEKVTLFLRGLTLLALSLAFLDVRPF